MTVEIKICARCGHGKPKSEYTSSGTKTAAGEVVLRGECNPCRVDRAREKRETTEGQASKLATARRYKASLRTKVFNGYGNKCACCDELDTRFLTVDHVNNNGAAHRRTTTAETILRQIIKANFPPEYQLLCWNCNCGKQFNGGVCPHKDPR